MIKSPQYRKILEGVEVNEEEEEESQKLTAFNILQDSHLVKQHNQLGIKDFVKHLADMSDLERDQIS